MPLQLCWGDRRLTLASSHGRAQSSANHKSRASQKLVPPQGPKDGLACLGVRLPSGTVNDVRVSGGRVGPL